MDTDHVATSGGEFATDLTLAAFMAIAWFNVIELHFILFSTFKRWWTLYLWSVLLTAWGIALNGLAVVLQQWVVTDEAPNHRLPIAALMTFGWYLMVTGFSVVLFSRLHLLVHDRRKVRGVLFLIIFSAVSMHIPITVICFLMQTYPDGGYDHLFTVYEPLQLIWFTLQETLISGLYIWYAVGVLRPIQSLRTSNTRTVIRRLIAIDVFVILLDITMIGVEFGGYDDVQHFYKACVYSIRLKLEFVILNQLLDITQPATQGSAHRYNPSNFVASHERSRRRTEDRTDRGFGSYGGFGAGPGAGGFERVNDIPMTHVGTDGRGNMVKVSTDELLQKNNSSKSYMM